MKSTSQRIAGALCTVSLLVAGAIWWQPGISAELAIKIPPPLVDESVAPDAASETAVLAGGCFWGVQAVFQHTQGVTRVVSGYAGGAKDTAKYEIVSSGATGHAEAVKISFDPHKITYGKLLQIYFSVAHDPTQLNRQGPDTGSQYRSAIFYSNNEQKRIADSYIAQLDAAKVYRGHVVTQSVPLNAFYQAEDYHQDYATLHPAQPYIAIYDLPKIDNLKRMFPAEYRAKPVTVAANQ